MALEHGEFGTGMDLCVFTDGILVELKNCSNERTKREKNRRDYEDQPFVLSIGMSIVHGWTGYNNGAGVQ